MTETTVTAGLTGYQQQAAELRRVAEVLASVPEGAKRPYFTLTIIVAENAPREVDALAEKLLGKPGKVQPSGDSWFHIVQDYTAGRALTVQSKVDAPPDPRDTELAELRARVAELEGAKPAQPPCGHLSGYADRCRDCGASIEAVKEAAKPASLVPAPIAKHYDASASNVTAECACGEVFESFAELDAHVAAANAEEPDGCPTDVDGRIVHDLECAEDRERGERVEVGADGCGCPVTEEIRPNDSSIDGTERVEHRVGCWNAPASAE